MNKTLLKITGVSSAVFITLSAMFALTTVSAEEVKRKSQKPLSADNPLDEIISGYEFRSSRTQALQDDDFENPAFLWVDNGEELWNTVEGAAGKSCASCHSDAEKSMNGVSASYPKYSEQAGKVINTEQRINKCRTDNMKAKAYKWESPDMLAITAYVTTQSKGVPVNVKTDGKAKASFENGEKLFYQRRGQLDLACSNCHEDNYGSYIRADMLSQGHSNGFPTYRLKWQGLGSLHRRFRGCNKNVRATPYGFGSQEYVDLELYLAWRGNGLPVESPSVRN